MDDKHLVAVIDFGSQYTQLIVRRVRELGYMAKLYALEDLDQIHEPGAVILSGGPKSATRTQTPRTLTLNGCKAWMSPSWACATACSC